MANECFTRKVRLLKPEEFKRVFDQTKLRASTRHVLILASPNGLEHPRIGFVLAKKQIKLAVDRNRVKRLIRESFRHQQSDLLALDFVILARPGLAKLDNRQIRDMIDPLWHRLKRSDHGKHTRNKKSA